VTATREALAPTSVGGRQRRDRRRFLHPGSGRTATYVLLVVGAIVFTMPLVIMVLTSFKSFGEINTYPPTFLPNQWVPGNYAEAWNYPNTDFPRWTFNTVLILALTLPGVVLSSSLVGYGFARLKFPGRDLWFALTIASIMLPPQVTLIPLYIVFHQLGWLDTFLPLIVPSWFGGGALNIFLMRQFYLGIPSELDDAALIDGAGKFTIWWRIYVPLSRPVMVTVALLTTLQIWNDFLGPLIYLTKPDNYTLAIGLSRFQGQFVTRSDYMMAISTLMVLPMVILFIFAQRYIVKGFITSGLKG
jgi:multiple sugar transport system permease protein